MSAPPALVARAAGDAAAACRAAAAALRAGADDRAAACAAARQTWEGPHRGSFDEALGSLERHAAIVERATLAAASRYDDLARQAAAVASNVDAGGGW